MAEWLIERGIGEDRALLVAGDRALAARLRWPGELQTGAIITAKLVSRVAGSQRGTAMAETGEELLVDRLPKDASEGRSIDIEVRRAAIAERGRLKRAQGRHVSEVQAAGPDRDDAFAAGTAVRRFPASLWEEAWTGAWQGEMDFSGGTVLVDVTPGMTVIDIDGDLPARDLALAATPAIARTLALFDLQGSIAIDFPTLSAKADRQAVDAALGEALAGWPHERTAMNGFGLVQIVARLDSPSLVHRLALRRAEAAARFLLRQAEAVEGAGAILLTAHPAVLAVMTAEWLDELARRAGREVRTSGNPALALGGGHAQIVPR